MESTDPSTDTKTKILNAAQELIQRRGLNAMSFQDLSDAVGIRKASVHHHFANKAEMVSALLTRYLEEFGREVKVILRSRGSGKTKLKRYGSLFLETLQTSGQDKSCLCGMLAAEMFSLDDEGLQLVRRFLRDNVEDLREIIVAGVEDGSLADLGDETHTAEMVLATLEGSLLLARCDGGPKRFAVVLNRLLHSLSAG